MNSLAFADAARPARSVILRLPMLDYSIGHEIILLRERNPLIVPDETADDVKYIKAIIRAAMVCSRTWEENRNPFRSFGMWSWFVKRMDFNRAIQDWQHYRAAGVTGPEVRSASDGTGRALGSPHVARLLEFAMKIGGGFDTPFGLAQWLYYSAAESEGGCIIPNEDEKKTTEQVDDLILSIQKEKEEAWRKQG